MRNRHFLQRKQQEVCHCVLCWILLCFPKVSMSTLIEELWPRVFVPKPINNPISRGGRSNCRFYWWADVGMSKCQVKLIIWWRRTYQLQLFQIIYPKVKSRSAIKIKKVKNYWVEQVHCWLNVVLLQFLCVVLKRFESAKVGRKEDFLVLPSRRKFLSEKWCN